MECKIEGCNLRLISTNQENRRYTRWRIKNRFLQPWIQYEVFSHFKKFVWAWIDPVITADMTSAPMIAAIAPAQHIAMEPDIANLQRHRVIYAGSQVAPSGRQRHFYHRIIRRWAFMDYAVRSPEEALVENGEVVFHGTEEEPVVMHSFFEAPKIKRIRCHVHLMVGTNPTRWVMTATKGGTEPDRIGLLCALNRGQYSVNDNHQTVIELGINTRSPQQVIDHLVRLSNEAGFTFDMVGQDSSHALNMDFYVYDDSNVLTTYLDNNGRSVWPSPVTLPTSTANALDLYYVVSRATAALNGKGPPLRVEATCREDDRLLSHVTFHRNRMFGYQHVNWGYASDLASRVELDCDTDFRDGIPVDCFERHGNVLYGSILYFDIATKNITMALEHLSRHEKALRDRQANNERLFESYVDRVKRRRGKTVVEHTPTIAKFAGPSFHRSLMLE